MKLRLLVVGLVSLAFLSACGSSVGYGDPWNKRVYPSDGSGLTVAEAVEEGELLLAVARTALEERTQANGWTQTAIEVAPVKCTDPAAPEGFVMDTTSRWSMPLNPMSSSRWKKVLRPVRYALDDHDYIYTGSLNGGYHERESSFVGPDGSNLVVERIGDKVEMTLTTGCYRRGASSL